MKKRHLLILILILICLFSVYDLFGSDVWAPVIIIYLAFYFPLTVLLFILSFIFRRSDNGWVKKFDTLGILISIILLIVNISYLIINK